MIKAPDIAVEAIDLGKSYGPVTAVGSVSFSVEGGRYFVLLGPSGVDRRPVDLDLGESQVDRHPVLWPMSAVVKPCSLNET